MSNDEGAEGRYQELPPLAKWQYADLEADIREHGVRVPVEVDAETGAILDGHNRVAIATALGKTWPRVELSFESEAAKRAYVLRANLNRRHLTLDQRKALTKRRREIAAELRAEGKTQAEAAAALGVSRRTVDEWEAPSGSNVKPDNASAPPDVRVKVPKQEQVKAAERVLDAGESTAQVAADLGVTERSVRTYRAKEEKRREKEAVIEATPVPEAISGYDLDRAYVCGIADLDLPAESVDLIVTDPPYHDEHVNSYVELGRLAARVLKPGCFACVYTGKLRLPQVIDALSAHLEYVWTIAVFHPFSKEKHLGQPYNIFENWRPVLVYKVPGVPPVCNGQQDVVRGERDKGQHDWQQDIATPLQLIASYTDEGGVILDPFSGGGTTAKAALDSGRHFLAFDVEPRAVKATMARCAGG